MFLQPSKFIAAIFLVLLFDLGCGNNGGQPRPNDGQPQNTHFAYVLNYNPNGPSTSTTIGVSDNSIVQTVSAGMGSVYQVFQGSPAATLFIANMDDDSVTVYSLATATSPVTINLPAGAHPVALVSTVNSRVFTANSGATAGCPNSGSVSAIDTMALTVVSTTCVGHYGPGARAIAQLPNGGKLYVVTNDASVSVLDPSGSTVLSTIGPFIVHPWNPGSVISSLDGSYVFVMDEGNVVTGLGGVWIITTSNDMLASSVMGGHPGFPVLDTYLNRLYVTYPDSNTVYVYDASKVNVATDPPMPILATVNVGSGPVGVTVLPDGTKFYVANEGSNDVTVVSASSFAVLSTVPVGQQPVFIQSEPTSSKIYVANGKGGSVSIIATADDTISTTIDSPPEDPTCTSGCTLQQPLMIITR